MLNHRKNALILAIDTIDMRLEGIKRMTDNCPLCETFRCIDCPVDTTNMSHEDLTCTKYSRALKRLYKDLTTQKDKFLEELTDA